MHRALRRTVVVAFWLATSARAEATAGTGGAQASTASPALAAPLARDDGWATATPAEVGLETSFLSDMEAAFARKELAPPDSLLLVKDGKLVYERYGKGFNAATPHDLRSATKSITSLLVGIALDRGLLADTRTPAFSLLLEGKAAIEAEPRKGAVTIEDLLTMRSGLACDDWDPKSPGQEDKMYRSQSWRRFLLALPVQEAPGGTMRYCTGGVVWLGALLAQAAAKPVPAFADEALFGPLRFGMHAWQPTPEGGTDTGGHLKLLPRDFAKIGQLVLDQGKWRGTSLVSAAWLAKSTASQGHLGDSDYGYLWWINTFTVQGHPVPVIFARGNGGQYLFIAPELRLVAAFNSSAYNRPEGDQAIALFGRFVLPAAMGLADQPRPRLK